MNTSRLTRIISKQIIGQLRILLILVSMQVTAQNDTIWYADNWKVTEKQDAKFYRIPVEEKNGLFLMQDFYISGNKQMVGTSKRPNVDVWQGKVTWYNEDGTIYQQGNYIDNKLEGEFITFLGDKKLKAIYKNGRFLSGKQNVDFSSGKYYKELKKDTLIEITYSNGLKGRRTERFSVKDATYYSAVYAKHFDKNGDLITEVSYDNGSPVEGGEVYFYSGTDSINTISYYKNSKFLGTTFYDRKGQVREKFYLEPEYKSVYFSKNGKKLDSIIYEVKDGRLSPYNGKKYYYKSNKENNEIIEITSIYNYTNGSLGWTKVFEENKLFSYTLYNDKNATDKIIYYDKKGAPKDSLLYKNYVPFNGTEYTKGYGIRKYEDGKVVEETIKYRNIDKVFKYRKGLLETFYDKEGNQIAVMRLKKDNYYALEEGTQLTIDYLDRITSEITYKNDKKVKEAYISYARESDLGYREETFFDTDGYSYIKKIKYYANGQKQSEIDYNRYTEKFGKYYDKDGSLLGSYDYESKDGKLYEFFYHSDQVQKMAEWNDGKLVRLLRYEDEYIRGSQDKRYLLLEDIDVTKEALIYARDGSLLSKLTYKNGEPFEGTFYDYQTRTRVTYQNGKRNGKYEKFDYGTHVIESGNYTAGLKEGKFTFYNFSGILTHFINYSKDKREGEATYFNADGTVASTMNFENDLPYDGKQIIRDYGGAITEVYAKGKLVSKLQENKTGDIYTVYSGDDEEHVTVYYPSTQVKKYDFTTKRSVLNGEVTRFDANGKAMHTANFVDGKFKSGEIWVLPNSYDQKDLEKIVCKKTDALYEVGFISKSGDEVFKAKEIAQVGIQSHIEKLNLGLTYINYQNLY
ncbi:toxin-antitoxin system YwqK family antitoxin [Croceitalea marina]|uniref:Toxin-antitoxin system YwqK family antitoxin n=1 Tax=Croceitalea marina TaxID=1775166 RepID=A0ABW5MSR9_9FLAO